jgi:glycosyltransferase involved in cell wall biosynthesis
VREGNFDVIHAHYGLSGLVAATQRQLPLVVSFCGDDVLGTSDGHGRITFSSRMIVWCDQVLARHAAAVIVKSREMRDNIRFESARAKTVVIPNGVDFERFKPMDREESRRLIGLEADRPYVLFPSTREAAVKRYDLAAAAVARARESIPRLELVVLSGRPQAEVPLFMNACNAMLLTSDQEGSPNVIKEAMACNLPIVSVNAGDAWDIIGGVSQCYKARRDADDLATGLVGIIQADRRSDGRVRIPHLALGAIAERVIDVYRSVLDGRAVVDAANGLHSAGDSAVGDDKPARSEDKAKGGEGRPEAAEGDAATSGDNAATGEGDAATGGGKTVAGADDAATDPDGKVN